MADAQNVNTPGPKPEREYCGGKLRGGREGTCRRGAGAGTNHVGIGRCKHHGGATRNHMVHAQKIMAQRTAALYGIPRHIDPADGLIEEYWRSAGIVAGLEAKVASLEAEDVVWGTAEITENAAADDEGEPVVVRTVKSRAGLNVWVKLFNEERDRFAKLGLEIIKLGLEARRDEYIRTQVELFAGVLLSPELALTDGQREAAARLLRGLDGVRVVDSTAQVR